MCPHLLSAIVTMGAFLWQSLALAVYCQLAQTKQLLAGRCLSYFAQACTGQVRQQLWNWHTAIPNWLNNANKILLVVTVITVILVIVVCAAWLQYRFSGVIGFPWYFYRIKIWLRIPQKASCFQLSQRAGLAIFALWSWFKHDSHHTE